MTSAQALPRRSSATPWLSLAALGVVFGDIGTSPIYAFREALRAAGAGPSSTEAEVLGVLSIILWSLLLIVTVKYVLILLRADNQGEGGMLSLLALALEGGAPPARWILPMGMGGAALFFGDALITPAISVLSAVEGMTVIEPGLARHVVPVSLCILLPLFLIQSRGTASVARLFGPVMLVWFLVLGAAGLQQTLQHPGVLRAINPLWALAFLGSDPAIGLLVLGGAFLAVTGAEALYADMGHFGRRPIMLAWLWISFPALLLNYFGQAALMLARPGAVDSPFFEMFPAASLPYVVMLAALATVIASQAVISGAFSLIRQAVQLRLLPRMRIRHTSEEQEGQIYLPAVNLLLMAGVMALVVGFGSSSALAAAYGISVTGTMLVTTLLAIRVMQRRWHWPRGRVLALMLPLLALELVFTGSNLLKIADGGWLPLGIAGALLAVMWSWRRGSNFLALQQQKTDVALSALLPQIERDRVHILPGTGVYLTSSHRLAPTALLHCLKHFHGLHETLLLVRVKTANQPRVDPAARLQREELTPRLSLITLTFGYAEIPDVPKALRQHAKPGQNFSTMTTSFILSRRRLRLSVAGRLPGWQARLFLWCARNSAGPTDYFRLPAARVVEIGTQVNI